MQVGVLPNPVADRERRAHGSLGVVLVRDRGAEERHHRVADELLHRAPEMLELFPHAPVVVREHRPHVLGVQPLRLRCRADQIAEEHTDDLPLLPLRRRLAPDRSRARPAKAEPLRVLLSAARAGEHGSSLRTARDTMRPSRDRD